MRSRSTAYNRRWRERREAFLSARPLCAMCEAEGRTTPATDVDHVRPHKGDRALFWKESNWQPLCRACHGRKTAAEDGGFGNAPRRPGAYETRALVARLGNAHVEEIAR